MPNARPIQLRKRLYNSSDLVPNGIYAENPLRASQGAVEVECRVDEACMLADFDEGVGAVGYHDVGLDYLGGGIVEV